VADTRVTFNSLTPNDQILTQAAKDVCPFLITDFEFTVAPGSNQGYVGLFQNITLLWRYTGEGDEDWRTVFQPAYFGNITGLSPFVPVFFRTGPGDVTAEVGEIIDRMVWSPRPEEEEPTDTLTVEFIVFFQGAISEQYPRLIDNITVGELIRDLYDGLHSPLDPVIGATEPSGILYDEAALLQMTDPVLLRLTESVDDARAWAESKGYAPSGWVPALDNQLLISPVSQVPPENFAGVRTINDNIAEATPDWNGGERVVNVLTFKYPRYYAPTDPTLSDGIDGILEREIVIEFRDEDSIRRFGEAKIEYDGRIFAAVGNANGDQVLTTQDETGRLLAGDRFTYVFERYRHAAQIITVPVRRAFSGDVRSGSFVIADLTWIPDYILQRRGGLFGGQVIAIRNVDCTWRVMTIEEILPLEQS
jgi:hypothetical protein